MSAKFDEEAHNGSVSIVFTRSKRDGHKHTHTHARNHSSIKSMTTDVLSGDTSQFVPISIRPKPICPHFGQFAPILSQFVPLLSICPNLRQLVLGIKWIETNWPNVSKMLLYNKRKWKINAYHNNKSKVWKRWYELTQVGMNWLKKWYELVGTNLNWDEY